MYNHKSIQEFIDKVDKEAEEAAQKVYEKYDSEFLQRIQNQMKEGDLFHVGMGVAKLTNKNGAEVAEKFCDTVGSYWTNQISASFDLAYKFTKTNVISINK